MLLYIHVGIAIASIVLATWSLVVPTQAKLRANYALIAATLGSGTFLVITTHSSLLGSCMSGLMYLSFIILVSALAHRRLVD